MTEPLGDGALRIPLPPGADARSMLEALRALPGVVDAVVTASHACVHFDPRSPPSLDRLPEVLAAPPRVAAVEIAVHYDGPDLARVAERAGLRPDEVAELHASREYAVRVVGFLPGFAYLGEVDARLALPRLASPRTRVPAGAVAIAGEYTGIYPFASPGGWNLIGTAVDFHAFSPERGAALQLGDRVRFRIAR